MHLHTLKNEQDSALRVRIAELEDRKKQAVQKQAHERKKLEQAQEKRRAEETKARQARFNRGLRGLLDRLTGKHRRLSKQNQQETRKEL